MQRVEYHIHVNHFEHDLPECINDLTSLGFRIKESCLLRNGLKSPLWLIAKKTESSIKRDSIYKRVLAIVEEDKSFRGYIESESVVQNNVAKYNSNNEFQNISLFPIVEVMFEDCVKSADIHIYRNLGNKDELDNILENNGFYEVRTKKKKIWTLLIKEISHSQVLYKYLDEYFTKSGGILELELELIKDLKIIPNSYSLPRFIRPVSFNFVRIAKEGLIANRL